MYLSESSNIKYGRNSAWNILLTTDTTMSFVKAFEVYQIRWNIEVMYKETKQYIPKKDSFDNYTDKRIMSIQKKLNEGPREKLRLYNESCGLFDPIRIMSVVIIVRSYLSSSV